MTTKTRMPAGLGNAGRRYWRAVGDRFDGGDLDNLDAAHLEHVCRILDRIADLEAIADSDGLMAATSQGSRVHPAIVEARAQRALFERLIRTLGLLDEREVG